MNETEFTGDPAEVSLEHAVDPLVLTVDVGTSSVRVGVFDCWGRAVSAVQSRLPYVPTTTADGGVTIEPEILVSLVCTGVDAVVHALHVNQRRAAMVACDTFWHAVLGTDSRGAALTPVYTWADTRAARDAQDLASMLAPHALHDRTGAMLHASYLPAKLQWIRRVNGATYTRVAFWMSFGEYLFFRLFGQRMVSVSLASGSGLMDQRTCAWDPELLAALQIAEAQLSPIASDPTFCTGLLQPFSARWPELNSVPWYLPFGDGACNNMGSGGVDARHAVVMIGTSGAIRIVRSAEDFSIPAGIWSYRVDRKRIVQGGALSTGGNIYAWLRRNLALVDPPALEDELAAMAPDSHGLTVLPFLAGERSPYWNADARYAMVGATLDTGPIDIVRACLEAVAYRFRLVYDLLVSSGTSPHGIIGSGAGLLHSGVWMQIMTDVLGTPMSICGVAEATSRGAALLVLEAHGKGSDLAGLPVPLSGTYAPSMENMRIYADAVRRQENLYRQLIG